MKAKAKPTAYALMTEFLGKYTMGEACERLSLHPGTIKRWLSLREVPDNYSSDLNHLLGNKYRLGLKPREKDQFYTNAAVSKYCYKKTLEALKGLGIKAGEYTFIEPAAGCCNFFNILPKARRIGIDIEPKGEFARLLKKKNYLDYVPGPGKYIVIGNPPFGLRGNLALRFINHSYAFADAVAFILPPLFSSTGKGVPMKRVKGYRLAHTEKLPSASFEYPDGTPVEVATIFQVWTKVGLERIKTDIPKTCKSFMRAFSLSDGGLPSNTRNKKMIGACDVYLPSTCFAGMRAYGSFDELPNRRGYGIVFHQRRAELVRLFSGIDWEAAAFRSTNGALNLRTDIIENELVKRGYHDE